MMGKWKLLTRQQNNKIWFEFLMSDSPTCLRVFDPQTESSSPHHWGKRKFLFQHFFDDLRKSFLHIIDQRVSCFIWLTWRSDRYWHWFVYIISIFRTLDTSSHHYYSSVLYVLMIGTMSREQTFRLRCRQQLKLWRQIRLRPWYSNFMSLTWRGQAPGHTGRRRSSPCGCGRGWCDKRPRGSLT